MRKENTLFLLWIIFGFVFINAIDSILYFFTYLVYFGTSEIGIPYSILNFIIPLITFTSYILTTTILLKKLKTNSKSTGIYLTEFPKKVFIILILISMFLKPITNKLSGLFSEYYVVNHSGDAIEIITFYGWMIFGLIFSRWVILIAIAFIYFNKYNSKFIKN